MPCLGYINKLDIPEILCSPLYPEWVDLKANPFGVQTLSWVPSKYHKTKQI